MSRKGAQDKTSTGKRSIPRPWGGRKPIIEDEKKVFVQPFVSKQFKALENSKDILQGIVDSFCASGEVAEVYTAPARFSAARSSIIISIKRKYLKSLFSDCKEQLRNWCIKQVDKYLNNAND